VCGSEDTLFHLDAIVKGLTSFVNVKQVILKYKPIGSNTSYSIKMLYRFFEFFYWTLRIFKEIQRFNADVILTQYLFPYALLTGIAGKLSRIPSVAQVIGSDLKIDPRKNWLNLIITRITLKITAGTICVSNDLFNIAERYNARNTIVIPSPLDLSDFKETNLPKKCREIISVANLTPTKGMPYLIQAMRYIKNGTLLIVGDGSEREKLEALALNLGLNERVHFLGYISERSRFWGYLQQATVFVLPSLSEGFPRALLEAMACGLPVVATNVGGIPELVTDGVNGFLVPPRNEKALAEAIERVLNDMHFLTSASSINKEVVKQYVLPVTSHRMYNYLKEITNCAVKE